MAVSNIEVAISARARWCRWTAPSAGPCSMSTGCRSVRLAGALAPCEVAACPGAPAVREALEVRKRWQQLRMAVVGAFDRADGDTVVGALEQRDRVASAHIARMLDGEVGARPGGVREPVDEGGVSHSHAELEAGHAGFGHPKDGGADLPALADVRGWDPSADGLLPDGGGHGAAVPADLARLSDVDRYDKADGL